MLKTVAKSSVLACAGLCATVCGSGAAAASGRPNANAGLPTYNFTYSYSGKQYRDLFIGTSPKAGGTSDIVTHIVPVKITVGSFVADPSARDNHGMSPVSYTVASPIYDSTTDYKQGHVDVGATQYIDAFNRVNEWGLLAQSKQAGWHVLLNPKVEAGLSFTNPSGATVTTDFGVKVVNDDISAFDTAIRSAVTQYPASDLVVFITTQLYLTSGGNCCIGGYRNYTGSQSYVVFSYITSPTLVFGSDVSTLSLELGAWLDDPQVNNSSPCGGYDVGDPPETGGKHPYGLWTYKLNGVAYHLRDMGTPVYFGAPAKTSANGFFTFQGYKGLSVCEGAPRQDARRGLRPSTPPGRARTHF